MDNLTCLPLMPNWHCSSQYEILGGGGGTEWVNRVTLGRKAGGVLDSSDVIGVGQRSRVQNDVGHSPENFEFRELIRLDAHDAVRLSR